MTRSNNIFGTVFTKSLLVSGCCAIAIMLPLADAWALEGGGSHYFGGNEDFGAGMWPPAGLSVNYSLLYFRYYRSMDADGHKQDIPGGFDVNGLSNSLRFMYTTGLNVLGGQIGWFFTPAFVSQEMKLRERTDAKSTFGDINFGIILKQDWQTFHQVIGTDIWAPTGEYQKDELVNIGLNYWSFAPTYAFTYLGDQDSPIPGFEVSARLAYYFHTPNHATGYTSGQEFAVDYLIGQRFGPTGIRVGINGVFNYQVTGDTYPDEDRFAGLNGNKAQQLTIGPAILYPIGNGLITLKALLGVHDVNRPEGDSLSFKIWYPL